MRTNSYVVRPYREKLVAGPYCSTPLSWIGLKKFHSYGLRHLIKNLHYLRKTESSKEKTHEKRKSRIRKTEKSYQIYHWIWWRNSKSITLVSISKEVFSIGNIVNIEHFSNLIEYFSNLIKLFRLSAWVLRLVTNTRIYNLRSGPHITRFSPVIPKKRRYFK